MKLRRLAFALLPLALTACVTYPDISQSRSPCRMEPGGWCGFVREAAVEAFKARVKPGSVIGLLLTVVLLFGFQGHVILDRPLVIAMIAVPLLIQTYGIFVIAYGAAIAWKLPFNVAAPCAMIATSNFFELSVAVAISLFGLGSGAALATVVGVLVEVPVMLSLVAFANRSARYFKP